MPNNSTEPDSKSSDGSLKQLLSPNQNAILEVIDDLKHIAKYNIELPRVIVCGDQSSGKSSVLEGLSRLNFPRGHKLCTTFATELSLRRGSSSNTEVSICWQDGKHPGTLSCLRNTIKRISKV
jgi:Dynamin family